MKKEPNLDGLVSGTTVFPWFQAGSPGADAFQAALKRYGGSNVALSGGMAQGWTAAKLLERAGKDLPEPPTREALLATLWSLRDENLGGITAPLTFTGDRKVQTAPTCWYDIVIRSGKWVSPDGYTMNCL